MHTASPYRFIGGCTRQSYGAIILFPPVYSDLVSLLCSTELFVSRARGMKEERERERDISKVYHRGLNLIMINGFTISNGKTNSRVECVCMHMCICLRNWISNEYFGGGEQGRKVTFSRATFL